MVKKTTNVVETKLTADDRASRKFSKLARSARESARQVGLTKRNIDAVRNAAIGVGLVAAGAAAGLLRLTGSVSERADEFAKLSRQVGFSAQSLQELEYIADRQGASFGAITGGIQTFTKRMGELRSGTGALHTTLSKMDPEFAKQLKSVEGNQEAYELLLGYISQLPDAQSKAAVAAAAVSKAAGGDLIRILDGGPEAIAELQAEVRRLRPAFTDEDLKAAEKYRDAISDAQAAMSGLGDEIGTKLMPILTPALKQFTEFVVNNREAFSTGVADSVKNITGFLQSVDWPEVGRASMDLASGLMTIVTITADVVDGIGGIENATLALAALWAGPKVLAMIGAMTTAAAAVGKLGPDGVPSSRGKPSARPGAKNVAAGSGLLFNPYTAAGAAMAAAGYAGYSLSKAGQTPQAIAGEKASAERARLDARAMASELISQGLIARRSDGTFRNVGTNTASYNPSVYREAANVPLRQSGGDAGEFDMQRIVDGLSRIQQQLEGGSLDVNIKVDGAPVKSVGTVSNAPVVSKVGTNQPGYTAGEGMI